MLGAITKNTDPATGYDIQSISRLTFLEDDLVFLKNECIEAVSNGKKLFLAFGGRALYNSYSQVCLLHVFVMEEDAG